MINLVLSGDNALVIAMASKDLPKYTADGRSGSDRRGCSLTVYSDFWRCSAENSILQAGGALLLIWIAVKLMMQRSMTMQTWPKLQRYGPQSIRY